jgi:putative intracellular protease/amidase
MNKKRKNILFPLPATGYNPTEVAITYQMLKHFNIIFSTQDKLIPTPDHHLLAGTGLGLAGFLLKPKPHSLKAHHELRSSYVFNHPIGFDEIEIDKIDAVVITGGHGDGVQKFLQSEFLQEIIRKINDQEKLIAAIGQGVYILAKAGVLRQKKVTSLPKRTEAISWSLTKKKFQHHFRFFSDSWIEDEVKLNLEDANNFLPGPPTLFHDSLDRRWPGFSVKDGHIITSRWSGDVYQFAKEIMNHLKDRVQE